LGTAATINQISYAPRGGWSGYANRMFGGIFQASNTADFSSGVVNLFTITSVPPANTLTTINVSASGTFRYVRYLSPNGSNGNIAEMKVFGQPTTTAPPPTQLTGTVIGTAGSYNNSGNTIAKAFDGNPSTFFDGPTANGDWAGLDLGTATQITSIQYQPRGGWSGYAQRMVGGIFQASNTANFSSGVVNLYTVTSAPPLGTLTTINVNPSGTFRYVRYLSPNGGYGNIAEIKFFGTASTAPTPLSGTVIGTSGSYQNDGNTIAKAFDGNLSTFFDAPGASGNWAGLDLGSAQVITSISYAPRSGWAKRMIGGMFQGSNTADFSGATTLYTITKTPVTGSLTTVSITNPGAFRYVRYLSPAGSYGNIAEAQFFGTAQSDPLIPTLQHALDVAQTQTAKTIASIGSSSNYPQYTLSNGTWSWVDTTQWTSGFFPGLLWQLYNATGNASYKTEATQFTQPIAAADTQTMDNGFRIYNTFLPLLQQNPGDADAINVMLTAAASKMTTYNATVGAFEAWRTSTSNNPKANFNVLMDLIMDSNLLFWASKQTGNTSYYNAAVQNAITEENYLVRPDGSSAQFAYFDSSTGQFIDNETYEGYSAASTWSRGQAWGIYGFAQCAAATGRADFLATAEKMADWYIAHLPADQVPYWDFNDPAIPNTYRDTSAAATAASGLLQLSQLIQTTDPADAARYRNAAGQMLQSLATNYLANPTQPGQSILLQGALNVPANPSLNNNGLIFGDYYFVEAINRYMGNS
jgi:unsaturated chondroitin disaccharide hydrolase